MVLRHRTKILFISILVGSLVVLSTGSIYAQSFDIPAWVKHTALLWAQGDITDQDFVVVLQFLINEGIITVPNVTVDVDENPVTVPEPELSPYVANVINKLNEYDSYVDENPVTVPEPELSPYVANVINKLNEYESYMDNEIQTVSSYLSKCQSISSQSDLLEYAQYVANDEYLRDATAYLADLALFFESVDYNRFSLEDQRVLREYLIESK